ncbi:MAG: hypothetical protein ACP5D2_03445 [Candidatus Nanoarchaeia archaeon]
MTTNLFNGQVKIGLIFIVSLIFTVSLISAGFGSDYLESIDGKPTLIVEDGIESIYHVYLQNSDTSDIYMKIDILNGASIVTNALDIQYEVPSGTQSDELPVEIKVKIPSGIEEGTVYKLKYSITTGGEDDSGIVVFSPVGFDKTIYISNGQPDWDKLIIDGEQVINEDPDEPDSPSNNDGGSDSSDNDDNEEMVDNTEISSPEASNEELDTSDDVDEPKKQGSGLEVVHNGFELKNITEPIASFFKENRYIFYIALAILGLSLMIAYHVIRGEDEEKLLEEYLQLESQLQSQDLNKSKTNINKDGN